MLIGPRHCQLEHRRRGRPTGGEAGGRLGCVVGIEVGRHTGVEPELQFDPAVLSTPDCAMGWFGPGSAFGRFPQRVRRAADAAWRDRWKSFIGVALVSTFTRIRWWPVFGSCRTARSIVRSDLQDGDARVDGVGGRACRQRLHPHRHGGDRGLLEAGLAHPRRWRFHAATGERGACEERARPKDRRERCDMAGGSAGRWPCPVAASCRTIKPRSCAACCARASSPFGNARAIRCASRRRSKTPTSSSTRSSATSSGQSGRRMIEALVAGESDPIRLAQLAHRNLKASAAGAMRCLARAGHQASSLPARSPPAADRRHR